MHCVHRYILYINLKMIKHELSTNTNNEMHQECCHFKLDFGLLIVFRNIIIISVAQSDLPSPSCVRIIPVHRVTSQMSLKYKNLSSQSNMILFDN